MASCYGDKSKNGKTGTHSIDWITVCASVSLPVKSGWFVWQGGCGSKWVDPCKSIKSISYYYQQQQPHFIKEEREGQRDQATSGRAHSLGGAREELQTYQVGWGKTDFPSWVCPIPPWGGDSVKNRPTSKPGPAGSTRKPILSGRCSLPIPEH